MRETIIDNDLAELIGTHLECVSAAALLKLGDSRLWTRSNSLP